MVILRTSLCAAAIVFFANRPVFAIPFDSALDTRADQIIEEVKHYRPGVWNYEYNPYSGYEYRPPTKWEQKGFCPLVRQKRATVEQASRAHHAVARSRRFPETDDECPQLAAQVSSKSRKNTSSVVRRRFVNPCS